MAITAISRTHEAIMAFDPVLEPGEQVSADFIFSNKPPRRLVLTNRATYWSGSKSLGFCVTTERVPLSQVVSVVIREEWHQGRLIVGFLMLISGVFGFVLLWNAQGHDLVLAFTIPVLLFVVGMVLAAAANSRLVEEILLQANNRFNERNS